MKFAAIDIGSNAVRLLFCNVHQPEGITIFKKNSLIRLPIRLGEDSFTTRYISKENEEKLVNAMIAFKHLINVHEPLAYRACATSAMRDAMNGQMVVTRVKRESGIEIEIISGKREAELIYANHIEEQLDDDKSYLYIDVGGGSTECTIFQKRKVVASQSFNIGTIRMLTNKVDANEWTFLKDWLSSNVTKINAPLLGIGSGGNINKLHSMAGKKSGKPMSFERLLEIYNELKRHTYKERVELMGLNPDRADVIIPASEIFIYIMRNADIKKIYVPEIGLSDGIVHNLFEEYLKKQNEVIDEEIV